MTEKGKAKPIKKDPIGSVVYGLCCFKCPHCGKLTEFDMHGWDAHGPLGTIRKKREADRDG